MGRVDEVQSEIDRLKGQLSRPEKTGNEAKRRAMRLRDLHRELHDLREKAGIHKSDEDVAEEYEAAKARFFELSKEPSKSDEFRMLGLANKLRRLEDELKRRGMEV